MDRLASMTVFARVAEAGSFSAAARRMNMSTTMVSNHVQALEQHLGARLLNRTTRRVSLTEVGTTYYERCLRILEELEEADRAAGLLQTTVRGKLRLFTGVHIAPFVSPVVIDFLRRHPEASVDLNAGERTIDMVEEGFDLAIRQGAQMIELDLHVTRDNHVAVIHDQTLNHTTNLTGFVDRLTLAEIKRADAGKGERVPTLDETLDLTLSKVRLYLEIKDPRAALPTLEIIRDRVANPPRSD